MISKLHENGWINGFADLFAHSRPNVMISLTLSIVDSQTTFGNDSQELFEISEANFDDFSNIKMDIQLVVPQFIIQD